MRVQIEAQFEPSYGGAFMQISGAARKPGVRPSQRKLCFVATDQVILRKVLLDLARRPDCFFVKYFTQPRDGMYMGRCFLLDDDAVGEAWRSFRSHPKLLCTIQDDDFALQFRSESE